MKQLSVGSLNIWGLDVPAMRPPPPQEIPPGVTWPKAESAVLGAHLPRGSSSFVFDDVSSTHSVGCFVVLVNAYAFTISPSGFTITEARGAMLPRLFGANREARVDAATARSTRGRARGAWSRWPDETSRVLALFGVTCR